MASEGPDLAQVTERQRAAWAAGDFNRIALSIMEVAEHLIAAADPAPGSDLLDVACGSGNVALVAARRYCAVTGLDFAPNLLEAAAARAAAEGSEIAWVEGDAQALPFEDGAFDTVTSVFGAMFAPDQERVAAELLRVCRPGGTIALATWGPGSFAEALFRAVAPFVPPPPGLTPPWRWGTEEGLAELLGPGADVRAEERTFYQRAPSPDHLMGLFREHFGPTVLAYRAAGAAGADALTSALAEAIARYDRGADGTCKVEGRYLEVLATRRR
jgi:SAM-dependent methyltransferase